MTSSELRIMMDLSLAEWKFEEQCWSNRWPMDGRGTGRGGE